MNLKIDRLLGNFVAKLIAEYAGGNVIEAVLLTHNYTESPWWHDTLSYAEAVFLPMAK